MRYLIAPGGPLVSRVRGPLAASAYLPCGSGTLQILMPASGSLSSFFLRGKFGTEAGSVVGAGADDAAAARRPPDGLCRLRLLAGAEYADDAGATAAVAAGAAGAAAVVGVDDAAAALASQALSLSCACRSAMAAVSTA